MTDEQLADLFAEGSAPARDDLFVRRVGAEIGRARRRAWFLVAMRALVFVSLGGAVFVSIRMLGPIFAPLAEGLPQLAGVPLPMAAGALVVVVFAQVLRITQARRIFRFRLG